MLAAPIGCKILVDPPYYPDLVPFDFYFSLLLFNRGMEHSLVLLVIRKAKPGDIQKIFSRTF